jgi:hypothetical protein
MMNIFHQSPTFDEKLNKLGVSKYACLNKSGIFDSKS